jgi:hypothetical protein
MTEDQDAMSGRMAELEARLHELEGAPSLRERGRGFMSRIVPPEAGRHFRNAGREQLLGVRAIVDFWIQHVEDSESSTSGSRRETIKID